MSKISAWRAGVKLYAEELLEDLRDNGLEITEANMLNGAKNWRDYSYGGCSLIYDQDIAERLCSPSELKKITRRDGSLRDPNSRETWLDIQARALYQAERLIIRDHKASRELAAETV